MMLFIPRCHKKLRKVTIVIFFLFIFLLISNPSAPSIDPELQPFDRSTLLHINGSRTDLGRASSIYVINLPSRLDRRVESIALMQTLNLEAWIVPAYSTESVEIRHRQRHSLLFSNTELACWASHMRVWITIANSTSCHHNSWSLIFEDDIDLEIDTPRIMQSIPPFVWNKANLIYLGHCANPPGKLIYHSSEHAHLVHQALHPSCTHAYAIRSDAARKLVYLLSKPSRPVDDSLVKLVNSHQLIAYSFHPPIAIQKPVSEHNPSNVNRVNRQTWIYRAQFSIYTLLQWLNGVEPHEKLNHSALQTANLTQAKQWRELYEQESWKTQH